MGTESVLLAALAEQFNSLRSAFRTLSKQPGPPGAVGPQGEEGVPGVAGLHGEVGPQGDAGAPGERGPRGATGERGPSGPPGEQGPVGPAPDHRWDGTKLQFEKPDGKWGPKVELRGPRGPRGSDGSGGGGGTSEGGGEPGPAGPQGDVGPAGPQGATTDAAVPYNIPLGETYTVAVNRQALFRVPITVSGDLVVNGYLIEV